MNLVSVLLVAAIAALLFLAVRYVAKHGICAVCEDKEACQKAFKAKGEPPASSCGVSCHSCPYYPEEQRMKRTAISIKKRAGE